MHVQKAWTRRYISNMFFSFFVIYWRERRGEERGKIDILYDWSMRTRAWCVRVIQSVWLYSNWEYIVLLLVRRQNDEYYSQRLNPFKSSSMTLRSDHGCIAAANVEAASDRNSTGSRSKSSQHRRCRARGRGGKHCVCSSGLLYIFADWTASGMDDGICIMHGRA